MRQRLVIAATAFAVFVFGISAPAEDLLQVYDQALRGDPAFKQAEANWQTARMGFYVTVTGNGGAGSGLFPNMSVGYSYGRASAETIRPNPSSNTYAPEQYSLSATQPIFNVQTWEQIASASYNEKAATATYLAAAQDLMSRSSNAYFEVLRANDKLTFILAQKREDFHQLETAQQKFKVGLIAITGVYNAQASYDADIANEIGARNNLANQIENLRAITGVGYAQLNRLIDDLPLVVPVPDDIDQWVLTADQQNYLLKSDNFLRLQALKNVDAVAAGALPTLSAVGSYVDSKGATVVAGIALPNESRNASALLQLNVPLLQGGYVIAATKQARFQYLAASDQLEIDHRSVVNQTRQAFLGVQAGISQIRADRQAIISAKNQLAATRAGYVVGTRTMVDVLQSVTNLTQAQQNWADDRYNYVEDIIKLKKQAGTLSPLDLVKINKWLSAPIVFQTKQQPAKHVRIEYPSVGADVNPLPPSGPSDLPTRVLPLAPLPSNSSSTPTDALPSPSQQAGVPDSNGSRSDIVKPDVSQPAPSIPAPSNTEPQLPSPN